MRFSSTSAITSSISASAIALLLFVSLLQTACQSNEEELKTRIESGKAFAEQGQHAEAVIEFRKALQIDPNRADAHYGLAQSYVALGNGQDALWELTETVRLEPSNAEARIKLGALALVAKDHESALDQADAAIALTPDVSQAHILRGQALEAVQRAPEAEGAYLRAVELKPDNGSYLYVLAGYYVRAGKREAAEPLLVKWTEIEPSFTTHTMLARFLAEDPKRYETAAAAFQRGLELAKPEERAEGYENLARLHSMHRRTDDATRAIEQGVAALDDDPKSKARLMFSLARLYSAAGRQDDATRVIEEAAKVDPGDGEAFLLLSMDRSQRGDLAGALEAAQSAREVAPENPKTTLRVAELLLEIGVLEKQPARVTEAQKIVEDVLAKEPTNVDAIFVKARIALSNGDNEGAIKLFRATIDARPDWPIVHYLYGSALALSGNTSGARASVSRAVELDPSLSDARRLLAQLHSALGEHEYAIEQGRIYLDVKPDPEIRILVAQNLAKLGRTEEAIKAAGSIPDERSGTDVLLSRARLYLSADKPAEAHKLLLTAVGQQPRNAQVLDLLLQVEGNIDQLDAAGRRIEEAAAAEPENAELARLVGSYQLRKGNDAGAEKAFQKAIELDEANIAAYRQLAGLYQRTGRMKETVETYELAIEKRPKAAQLHYFLGTLYETEGRDQDAIAKYEKALELQPDLIEAKNNLAYLLAESGTNLDRALDLAQEAKAAAPESPNAADTLGWVLYRRGIPSAAVGYLREAVAGLEADSAEIALVRHHLALAYEANDQKEEAIATLEQALSDLARTQAQLRASGVDAAEPPWSVDARERLARLKPAG